MQANAFTYLASRFAAVVYGFFVHAYAGSFLVIARATINALEALDRSVAWRVTLRHLFDPMYQDYSAVGRLFGFVFRSLRLAAGSFVYAILIALACALYLVWIAIPTYLIYLVAVG